MHADRSKQFLMFDSLKGFRTCLKQKERIVVAPVMLLDDALEELDFKIRELKVGEIVSLIYYDKNQYVKITGMIASIDLQYRKEIQVVKTKIPIKNIFQILE